MPRTLLVRSNAAGVWVYRRVICNPTNAAFLAGPGGTVVIAGLVYTIQEREGESALFSN
jgi:hypothetical protein